MAQLPDDYFVEIRETLVGRKPGAGAAEKARGLRRVDPLSIVRSMMLRQRTERYASFGLLPHQIEEAPCQRSWSRRS